MDLDELLDADEDVVAGWLGERNLLHECNCGYTVYDPDDVSSGVQEIFGDERSDEIANWADGLDRYGWLYVETSNSKHDIYHCQHCAGSELALLFDLEKIAGGMEFDETVAAPAPAVDAPLEPCVVYVDESYTEQFPRKSDGSLSFAALIVPEGAVEKLKQGVADIIQNCYRGSRPEELKYTKISKHPGLLDRVGREVAALIKSIPECAVIGIYVPSSGLFGEKLRALHAIGHYSKQAPTMDELEAIESPEAVEKAFACFRDWDWTDPRNASLAVVFSQACRVTGHRAIDLSATSRGAVAEKLRSAGAQDRLVRPVLEFLPVKREDLDQLYGEPLPLGLAIGRF